MILKKISSKWCGIENGFNRHREGDVGKFNYRILQIALYRGFEKPRNASLVIRNDYQTSLYCVKIRNKGN